MSKSGLDFTRLPDFNGRSRRVIPYLERGLRQLAQSLGEVLRQKTSARSAEDVAFVVKFATPAELSRLAAQDFAELDESQIRELFDYACVESYQSNGRSLQEAALDALAMRIKKGAGWEDAQPTGDGTAFAMSFRLERQIVIVGLAGVPKNEVHWAVKSYFGQVWFPRRAA